MLAIVAGLFVVSGGEVVTCDKSRELRMGSGNDVTDREGREQPLAATTTAAQRKHEPRAAQSRFYFEPDVDSRLVYERKCFLI